MQSSLDMVCRTVRDWTDVLCRAGSDQQAQSTHLAGGL